MSHLIAEKIKKKKIEEGIMNCLVFSSFTHQTDLDQDKIQSKAISFWGKWSSYAHRFFS